MDMHHIRYFLAVATTLNFTRAAEQCNVTQPALSRAIQQLEEEVGEAGEIDIATMAEAEGFPPRFDFETLYKERFVIGFSPGHRFAEKASIAIVDVDGETYLRRLNCEFRSEFSAAYPGVLTRPVVEPEVWRDVCFVSISGRRLSPAVLTFVNTVRQYDWAEIQVGPSQL